MQNENIKIGEKYKHYKTKDIYIIFGFSTLQAPDDSGLDMKDCVIYKKENEDRLWTRTKQMFLEKVKNENGEELQRFEKVLHEDSEELIEENVFDVWNSLKKDIDINNVDFSFSEKEIWWCSLGKNIGNEQDGKNRNFERPVLIFKKWNSEFFVGLPKLLFKP